MFNGWFTIIAQALNFLILMWLLKRFLYKPILHAIDAREKRVAAELADADAKKAQALKERDDYQQKIEAFNQQRAEMLAKATQDVEAEHNRMLDDARNAAEALSAKRQEAFKTEARNLNHAINQRIQQHVFSIARKALANLAATSLEERLCDVFIQKLGDLDEAARVSLGQALTTTSEPALIRSAFELPTQQREVIRIALNETFSAEISLRYETAPDLISGIELIASGQKLAWSIADYLTTLETSIDELLIKPSTPPAPQGTKAESTPA